MYAGVYLRSDYRDDWLSLSVESGKVPKSGGILEVIIRNDHVATTLRYVCMYVCMYKSMNLFVCYVEMIVIDEVYVCLFVCIYAESIYVKYMRGCICMYICIYVLLFVADTASCLKG